MRIEIWVDGTDPPTGRVGDRGGSVPFCGWIDLLAVLSEVLEAPRDEQGELGAGAQAQLGEDVRHVGLDRAP